MLKDGDVIFLSNETCVLGNIKEKFLEGCRPLSNNVINTTIKIGKKYIACSRLKQELKYLITDIIEEINSSLGVSIPETEVFEFTKKHIGILKEETFIIEEGEFVVTKIESGGYNSDRSYRDGSKTFCKRLKNGVYDPNGAEVSFYQGGCYVCVIDNLVPIRTLTKRYT